MEISRRILAAWVAALVTGSVLTAISPADATVSGSRHGAESTGTIRAAVTDIREILNQRSEQVDIFIRERHAAITIQPNGRWAGSMWVPWVGNDNEMSKSLIVHSDRPYQVFQDYWDPSNAVEYILEGNYKDGQSVPGSSTGGGRKRLIIRSDGSLFLETTN